MNYPAPIGFAAPNGVSVRRGHSYPAVVRARFGHMGAGDGKPAHEQTILGYMGRFKPEKIRYNLGPGIPAGDPPPVVQQALVRLATEPGAANYGSTIGLPGFRRFVAESLGKRPDWQGIAIDPDTQVTATAGATGGMYLALKALLDKGHCPRGKNQVVVFEPYYDNYVPQIEAAGGKPRFVKLKAPDWSFDPAAFVKALGPKTRAVILNSPHNPTGKVFSADEMKTIADACRARGIYVVSDEPYDAVTFDGARHVSIATLPGMQDQTITLGSYSKTYNVGGERIGYAVASPELTRQLRAQINPAYVCANTRIQKALPEAAGLPPSYYRDLAQGYEKKRDAMLAMLREAGIKTGATPKGGFFVMADIGPLVKKHGFKNAFEFIDFAVDKLGLILIPGAFFYHNRRAAGNQVRIAFVTDEAKIRAVGEALKQLPQKAAEWHREHPRQPSGT